jgi:hypothetical protein
MDTKKAVALEVVSLETGEVVRTIPLQHSDERYVNKVTMGLLRNMDLERYSVREKVGA